MDDADQPGPTGGAAVPDRPLLHLLWTYGRDHWSAFAVAVGTQTLGLIPSRLRPVIVGVAFDALFLGSQPYVLPLVPAAWIPTDRMAQYWLTAGLLAATFLLGAAISVVSGLAYGWFQQHLLHDLRTDTYDSLQRLRPAYFDDTETGHVLSVVNNDVENLQTFANDSIGNLIRFPISVGVAFAFMALLNAQLAAMLLVVPVVIFGFSYWFSRVVAPRYEAHRENVGALNTRLDDTIGGIEAVKAASAEPLEGDRVAAASRDHLETREKIVRVNATIKPTLDLVQNLGITALIVVGAYWILVETPPLFSGTVTAGTLLTFTLYVRGFVGPMRNLTNIVDAYENAKASSRRIAEIRYSDAVLDDGDVSLSDVDGRVTYEDVSFAYDGAEGWTLRDVCFDAAPGETVGVVGQTGAGKSTLVKLLLRLYDVDSGAVRLDGHDVRDLSLGDLRSAVGYVPQDPFLFYGTVRENVAFGDPDPDHDAVVAAARQAGAHEFVTDLPDGYDTAVGERGVKLSGGQRQRVAIARALYQEPAVLVLDEATSHVDNETEARIQASLDDLSGGVTTLVVAHRLSTVRGADRILALEDGEVLERGTHEELLAADGLYANLWRVQVGDVESLPRAFLERTRELEASK